MSRKPYYELHVTLIGHAADVKPMVVAIGWKFSSIDGDPVLGPGVKCYATLHLNCNKVTAEMAQSVVQNAANKLSGLGATVLREKLELVLYDQKLS